MIRARRHRHCGVAALAAGAILTTASFAPSRALADELPGDAQAVSRAHRHEIKLGSFCRLPEPGEKPVCLQPARDTYGEFFAAVEEGHVSDDLLDGPESALVAEPGSYEAYVALTSIAFGYLSLARHASDTADMNPELAGRLERWNELLSETYARRSVPAHFKDALRQAADDLHFRVSNMRTSCVMASGRSGGCSSGLVGALREADEAGVVRSPMRRLIERIRGNETNP
jgi:hypothetical protein